MKMLALRWKNVLAFLLAAVMLGGCAGTARPEETAAAPAALETARQESGRSLPAWAKTAVIYEVNIRQYTPEGSFAAFSRHLQTLKDMGITTLWFMPIHPISETKRSGTLGSYYSVSDYRSVNPEFGTEEDFRELVEKAHGMGFTVMLDWVANHTGWDCPWIKDHPDWYTRDAKGNITDPVGMGWPDVADLNYGNQEMRREMIACMKYWVEEFGIDGFRCDYASGVPVDFWEEARRELETVKPLLMLAEDEGNLDLLDYAFDCSYNWGLYDILLSVAADKGSPYNIRNNLSRSYPEESFGLNFLDNHDKNSWEDTIMEAFGPEALPGLWTLSYTIPGMPMVYSGDEIGLDHHIAFMERDPIDWDSSPVDYRPLLAELAALRRDNPALHSGSWGGKPEFITLDKRSALAYTRRVEGNTVTCLLNLTKREMTVDVTELFAGADTVLLHGQGADVLEMEDQPLALTGEVTMQPWEFWVVSGS